jgi:hypothetical protein
MIRSRTAAQSDMIMDTLRGDVIPSDWVEPDL